MSETDKYYVERYLDGYPDDFRYLVRRYQTALLAYIVGKLGGKAGCFARPFLLCF